MMRLRTIRNALAEGVTSSEAFVTQALERATAIESLNAFITLDESGAVRAARASDQRRLSGSPLSPLDGVPIAVKDSIAVKDLPWTGGCGYFRDFIASTDAPVVAKLRACGMVILGKTNMDELALGVTSQNEAFGSVGNAADKTCLAGGSSGGSAVAVATGIVPVALGSDTGGSGRIPAALNGCAAHRPSLGLMSAKGTMQLTTSRDTISTMAADTDGLQGLLNALVPSLPADPLSLSGLRFGLVTAWLESSAASVQDVFSQKLSALSSAGVRVQHVNVAEIVAIHDDIGMSLMIEEASHFWTRFLQQHDLGSMDELTSCISNPGVRHVFEDIKRQSKVRETKYFHDILPKLHKARLKYAQLFSDFQLDAILFPLPGVQAPPLGTGQFMTVDGQERDVFSTLTEKTALGSLTGHPGISVPIQSKNGGMPIGLGLDGPIGSDARLLSIASRIESCLNGTPGGRQTTSA